VAAIIGIIISAPMTISSFADTPVNEVRYAPKPSEVTYVNNKTPDLNFDSPENNFRHFRLHSNRSLAIRRFQGISTNPIDYMSTAGSSDSWSAYFMLGLDNLKEQVNKGDLEYKVVFNALNKKRSVWYEDDYINAKVSQWVSGSMYPVCVKAFSGKDSPELMHYGWKDNVSTDWIPVDKTASILDLHFFSSNAEASNDDTGISYPRVYFRDKNAPQAKSVEAVAGTYKLGERVDFKLVFDEAIKLNGNMPGNLNLYDGSGNFVIVALCDGVEESDSKKLKYHFEVPPGKDIQGLRVSIPNSSDNGAGGNSLSKVTDMAGNYYAGGAINANGLFSVNIDSVGPKIKLIDIPGAHTALKEGSTVTVNVQFSEKIKCSDAKAPTLKMNTGGIAVASLPISGASDAINFKYTVGASDTQVYKLDVMTNGTSGGPWTIDLTGQIVDGANNPMPNLEAPVKDSSTGKATSCQAKVDKTAPIVAITPDNTDWAKTHTLTVAVKDEGTEAAGIDQFSLSSGYPFRVLKIGATPQINPTERFNAYFPAGEDVSIELCSSSRLGKADFKVLAADKAGNSTEVSTALLQFDDIAPKVGYIYYDAKPDSTTLKIVDNEGGFNASDIKLQWTNLDEDVNAAGWEQLGESGTYAGGEVYSIEVSMPAEGLAPGVINQKKLYIKAADKFGNEEMRFIRTIYKDLGGPVYKMDMPSSEYYEPYFSCWAEGTVVESVYTDITYKWVKPNINPLDVEWVSDKGKTFESEPAEVEKENYFARPSAQRYFNNGELFNGAWLLYLKAEYSGNGSKSYPGPFSYNFDNVNSYVAILSNSFVEGGDTPTCEKDVNISISEGYEGEEFPLNPSSGSYYSWDGDTSDKKYITGKETAIDNIIMPETGKYLLEVFAKTNTIDAAVEAEKYLCFDYDSPWGAVEIDAAAKTEEASVSYMIKASDITSGDKAYLEYSTSVDDEDWGPWKRVTNGSYDKDDSVPPSQEQLDKVAKGKATFYSVTSWDSVALPNRIQGMHTISFKIRDSAGNESEVYSYKVNYETTPPTGVLKYSTTDKTNQDVTVTLDSVRDNFSQREDIWARQLYGSDSYEFIPWDRWSQTFSNNVNTSVKIRDKAGNITELPIIIDYIDKTKPVIEFSTDPAGTTEGKHLTIDAAAYDVIEGIKLPLKLYYCFSPYDKNPDELGTEDPEYRFKEAASVASATEEVTKETRNGIEYYTINLSNYNQGSGAINHTLYLKTTDGAGNTEYVNSINYRLVGSEPRITETVYTPDGVNEIGSNVKTGGPAKVRLKFDEPVILVPLYGDYSKPVDLSEYKISHNVYVTENGPQDIRVVNKFGTETVIRNAITMVGIDSRLKAKTTCSPGGWTNGDVTITVEAGLNQLIYGAEAPGSVAQKVAGEGETIFELNGKTITGYKKVSYRFIENGVLSYMVYNTQGKTYGQGFAIVDKIDRVAPTASIAYDSSNMYNDLGEVLNSGYVKATLYNLSDNSNVANAVSAINEGGAIHIFPENGSFDFVLKDLAGNTTAITAIVNNINKTHPMADTVPPTADVSFWVETAGGPDSYDNSTWTGSSVHAVIAPRDESPVTITNNAGRNEYVFTENGSFTFNLVDGKGNSADITVSVDKIDKLPPEGSISYKEDISTKNVTAALEVSDNSGTPHIMNTSGIDGVDAEGRSYHVFTESGSFIFYVQDTARNTVALKAQVNGIDKTAPHCTIKGIPVLPINKDVRVIIEADEAIGDAYLMSDSSGSTKLSKSGSQVNVLFTENANTLVRIEDLKGNHTDVDVNLSGIIDRILPQADIEKDESRKLTEGIVTVKLINIRDNISLPSKIKVLNNYGSISKNFDANGTYTFVIADEAGNQREIPMNIAGIDNTPPELSLMYNITERTKNPVTATLTYKDDSAVTILNNNGSPIVEFVENGAFTFMVQDASGNKSSIRAKAENIDNKAPVITFDNTALSLVFIQDGEYKLEDCHAVDNIDGDVTSRVSIAHNGFDINKPGEYNVVYTASDLIGNIALASRKVIVVPKDILKIYINGKDAQSGNIITNGPAINLQIMNAKGNITTCWKQGKLALGMMKSGGKAITGSSFEAKEIGWYTIFIQGQEKNSQLIHIYVSSIAN